MDKTKCVDIYFVHPFILFFFVFLLVRMSVRWSFLFVLFLEFFVFYFLFLGFWMSMMVDTASSSVINFIEGWVRFAVGRSIVS